jgi:hypothetical protein
MVDTPVTDLIEKNFFDIIDEEIADKQHLNIQDFGVVVIKIFMNLISGIQVLEKELRSEIQQKQDKPQDEGVMIAYEYRPEES